MGEFVGAYLQWCLQASLVHTPCAVCMDFPLFFRVRNLCACSVLLLPTSTGVCWVMCLVRHFMVADHERDGASVDCSPGNLKAANRSFNLELKFVLTICTLPPCHREWITSHQNHCLSQYK